MLRMQYEKKGTFDMFNSFAAVDKKPTLLTLLNNNLIVQLAQFVNQIIMPINKAAKQQQEQQI